MEVSTQVTGYIVKRLNERFECDTCFNNLIARGDEVNRPETAYINSLSRGGLIVPSVNISNFVSTLLANLEFIDPFVSKYPSLKCRDASMEILERYVSCNEIFCQGHNQAAKRRVLYNVCNVFYNNKRKEITTATRKQAVQTFKTRQRSKKDE